MRKRQKLAKVGKDSKYGAVYSIRGPKSHRTIIVAVTNTDFFTKGARHAGN